MIILTPRYVTESRDWKNWVTSDELAQLWKVSQRRVQQILSKRKEDEELEVGVLVIDIGGLNPVSKPIYRLVFQR